MTRAYRFVLLVCLALSLAACPKRFDPRARPGLPKGGDAGARDRFQRAQALFEKDDYEAAAKQFDAIAREYPDDPIRPHADLYAGIAAYKDGKLGEAAGHLEPLVQDERAGDDVRARARFWLGLAWAAEGKHAAARELLEPFDGKLVDGEEKVELDAALAAVYDGLGDGPRALRHYDRFFGAARPAERAHIVARVAAIVDGLTPDAARAAWGKVDKGGPSAALLGRRVALEACARGDVDEAREILEDSAGARAAAGLPAQAGCEGDAGDVDSALIGVVLPLSGKRRLVGEALLRGVTMVVGAFEGPGGEGPAGARGGRPFWIEVRDGGESPEGAAKAVDELARGRVIAVVGPADKDAAKAAAERAEAAGLPLLSLDVADGPLAAASPHVFRVVVPVEVRARALARAAVAAGARDFAVLAPDMTYGTRAAKAFTDEVTRLGGKVVVSVTYAKDATSFVDPVKKLAKVDFHALFVPDTAARLELIAPQLAVANLVVAPPGAKKPKRGRAIVLLSTAEALAPAFLRGSGRYTVGALFAPGFYPDDQHPRIGPFVQRFRAAYGTDPTYLDAYGFDAGLCVRAAVGAGAQSRAGVAAWLARNVVPGLTGDIRFDENRQRSDEGVLYQVVSDGAGGQAIRALGK